MKWLIYALLLLNLAFGLWHLRSQQVKFVEDRNDDESLRLVLLTEYLNQQAPTVRDSELPIQANARCYTLGPFKSKSDASTLGKALDAMGIAANRRMSKDNSRQGYWVFIPPEDNRTAAKEHITALKEKGITDYFLVATGERTNAVSLGVYSKSDLAQRRLDEIKAMGFTAKIDKVDLPLREYWLDWPIEQTLLPDALEKFRQQYPGIGQTERGCTTQI
jgi:hypothetical protein